MAATTLRLHDCQLAGDAEVKAFALVVLQWFNFLFRCFFSSLLLSVCLPQYSYPNDSGFSESGLSLFGIIPECHNGPFHVQLGKNFAENSTLHFYLIVLNIWLALSPLLVDGQNLLDLQEALAIDKKVCSILLLLFTL